MNRDKADLRDFPDFSSSTSAKQLRAKSTFATCLKVVGEDTNNGKISIPSFGKGAVDM